MRISELPMTSSPMIYGLLHKFRATAFLALLLLFASATGASAQDYTVTNLGSPGSSITSINASGQVAFFDKGRGYFYDGATVHDLGSLGGYFTLPLDMNASGQVVGYSVTAEGRQRAFSWTLAGGMVDLGTLGGVYYTSAAAVNASGQVVGYSDTAEGHEHAFSWTKASGMVDLGTLGGSITAATAINAAGQVVGRSYTAGNIAYHAFLWTKAGGMVDLGTLGGGSYSSADAVNDAGQVIGWSRMPGQQAPDWPYDSSKIVEYVHAFSWTKAGGMVDLSTSVGDSYAFGVNSAGRVIGFSQPAGGDYHPFSWTKAGGVVDLGALGVRWNTANAVNNAGQVVGGSAVYSSDLYRAFSWTQKGGLVDLNDHIPTAPPGMELYSATHVTNNGLIGAYANTGTVLLGRNSKGPALGPISVNDPGAARFPLSFSASFTDTNKRKTHKAVWSWGDGSPTSSGTVSEAGGAGTVSKSHTYFFAGNYYVSLTITDGNGHAATVIGSVSVYPSAGFVTGGG